MDNGCKTIEMKLFQVFFLPYFLCVAFSRTATKKQKKEDVNEAFGRFGRLDNKKKNSVQKKKLKREAIIIRNLKNLPHCLHSPSPSHSVFEFLFLCTVESFSCFSHCCLISVYFKITFQLPRMVSFS